ncbi:hypothetical protein PR048_006545 [Dryococelus australis]|uniref:Uncharacterized protein n=1 Tax=Dryococelus australis TaxID=614101 RepID=A0ABQ9IB91_9NEOP|nr:hypothetical protein PR048_006545 [Dryococelus australis]
MLLKGLTVSHLSPHSEPVYATVQLHTCRKIVSAYKEAKWRFRSFDRTYPISDWMHKVLEKDITSDWLVYAAKYSLLVELLAGTYQLRIGSLRCHSGRRRLDQRSAGGFKQTPCGLIANMECGIHAFRIVCYILILFSQISSKRDMRSRAMFRKDNSENDCRSYGNTRAFLARLEYFYHIRSRQASSCQHGSTQWRAVKCCKVSWRFLSAVHARCTQQESVTRVEPGEMNVLRPLTREQRSTHTRCKRQQNGVTRKQYFGTPFANQRHMTAQRIGNLAQHEAANRTQGSFPKTRVTNDRMDLPTSKEPPVMSSLCTYGIVWHAPVMASPATYGQTSYHGLVIGHVLFFVVGSIPAFVPGQSHRSFRAYGAPRAYYLKRVDEENEKDTSFFIIYSRTAGIPARAPGLVEACTRTKYGCRYRVISALGARNMAGHNFLFSDHRQKRQTPPELTKPALHNSQFLRSSHAHFYTHFCFRVGNSSETLPEGSGGLAPDITVLIPSGMTRNPMRRKRGAYGAALDCKGGGNGISLRKPVRHRPTQFPLAEIQDCAVAWRVDYQALIGEWRSNILSTSDVISLAYSPGVLCMSRLASTGTIPNWENPGTEPGLRWSEASSLTAQPPPVFPGTYVVERDYRADISSDTHLSPVQVTKHFARMVSRWWSRWKSTARKFGAVIPAQANFAEAQSNSILTEASFYDTALGGAMLSPIRVKFGRT